MLKHTKNVIERSTRTIISIVVSFALIIPAIPLSDVTQAYATTLISETDISEAEESSLEKGEVLSSAGLENDYRNGHIQVDAALSGGVDNFDGNALCGNCLDEDGNVESEVVAQAEEYDRQAEENLAEVLANPPADVVEEQLKASEEIEASFKIEAALSDEDMVVPLYPEDETTHAANADNNASAFGYSAVPVLKDVQRVVVYSGDNIVTAPLDGSSDYGTPYVGYDDDKQWDLHLRMLYIKMYRIPSFYAKIIGGYRDGRDYYFRVELPRSKGEEAKVVDIYYGKTRISPSNYLEPPVNRVVEDSTILASLAEVDGYDSAKNNSYLNAYKLAPFASYADIVKSGNAIPAESPLATKNIQELWPVHKDDGMKVSLFEGDEADVVRSLIYFSDGTSMTYDLDYLSTANLVASYVMADTGVLYQPDFWLLGESAQHGIDRIANFIRSKTWNGYYGSFAKGCTWHRTLRDHFDHDMHDNAEEVAANIVSNIDVWNANNSSHGAWNGLMNMAETAKPPSNGGAASELNLFSILFQYAYFERFFGFDYGGSEEVGAQKNANPFLIMAFRGSIIRNGLSLQSMSWDVKTSRMLSYTYVDKLGTNVFNTVVGNFTGFSSPVSLIEHLIRRTTGYADVCNWFADYMTTIAFYEEYKPPQIEGGINVDELVWRGWDQVKRYPNELLLWLTLNPGSQYMASSSMLLLTGSTGTYETGATLDDAHRQKYRGLMDNVMLKEARYASTVASIVGASRPNSFCVVGYDGKYSKADGTAWMERENFFGKTLCQDDYLKNFSDTTGHYITNANGAAAMTINMSLDTKMIYFCAYFSLNCGWDYYWSHEMAHALDNTIFLNGSRRAGTEDYTDGLLTQQFGTSTYIMNLTNDFALSSDYMTNYTRERIAGEESLNDYYSKMYDALDLLDYAALKAFLNLDKDQQNAVASQARYDGHNGNSALDAGATSVTLAPRNSVLSNYDGTASSAPLNLSAFNDGSKKIETVEDVYDNQIFLYPELKGSATWLQALYVADGLNGVWWHPIHNNGDRTDSRSFKIMMYRMLGRHGFEAWQDFGRPGGGDLAKLKASTGYDSFREWQLARWNELETESVDLTYVEFGELVAKFESALKADAENGDRNLTQMANLRNRMYFMMKRMTNDFRYGVFEDQTPVTHIRSQSDLLAIAQNPYGNYVIDNDIVLSGLEEGAPVVEGTFYGKLDGQGHSISTDNTMISSLFSGAKHAYIKELTIKGCTVEAVAVKENNCEKENIFYEPFERNIKTVEDLLKMNGDLKAGVDTFHLLADLDLSGWSDENSTANEKTLSVITQVMSGSDAKHKVFNGNGHIISGLKDAALFDKVYLADIHDLKVSGGSNDQPAASGDHVSLIARYSARSSFENIFFEDVSLRGRYHVGFVSGEDGFIDASGASKQNVGSAFSRIQVTNGSIVNGDASVKGNCSSAGFIAGRVFDSDIENVFVQGKLTSFGTQSGGVLGAIVGSARLDHCISNVDIESKHAGNNGVLLGDIEKGGYVAAKTKISNCLGLGNPAAGSVSQVGRLAKMSADAIDVFEHCYESSAHRTGESLSLNQAADVQFVRASYRANVRNSSGAPAIEDFYKLPYLRQNKAFFTDLGFSEDIWSFDPTIGIGYPMLDTSNLVGDFSDYDLGFYVDFKNELLVFTGEDFDRSTTKLDNIAFRLLRDINSYWKKGTWVDYETPLPLTQITPDERTHNISELIEYEEFLKKNEVKELGYSTLALSQSAAVSGKAYDFEMTLQLPPRPNMIYVDRVKGIRANSKGVGYIQLTSSGSDSGSDDITDSLEYRPVADADNDSADQAWIPIESKLTAVQPGNYEVRIASTDHSFASYPTTITVGKFDPNAVIFPLILDSNGGKWADGYQAITEYNNEEPTVLPTSENISRAGYTFTGWYKNADLSGTPITEISAGTIDPLTLYAGWEAKRYPVTLELNGGFIEEQESLLKEYIYGKETMLPTPTHNKRVFAGWFDNEACEGDAVQSILATDMGEKRFWAKWEPILYNVTLHLQGGSLSEGLTDFFEYEFGKGVALPAAESILRKGYSFAGWFDNEACAGNAVRLISDTDSGDKTYWAKWDANIYDVVLAKNHGVLAEGQSDVVSYKYGSGVVLPLLERPGYEFGGWYENADFTGSPVLSITPLDIGNKSYWAKWIPRVYEISFDLGSDANGVVPPAGIDLSRYQCYVTGEAVQLPGAEVMVWKDHVFAGWYKDATCIGAPITTIPAGTFGDINLYAKWVGRASVISFYCNEGTFAVEPKTVYEVGVDGFQFGDTVELPKETAISRPGYVFEGWFNNALFSGDALASVVLDRESIQLYAKWAIIEYGISYELNGGSWVSGYVPLQRYTIESEDIILPSSDAVVREGYSFMGWFEGNSGEGKPVNVIPGGSAEDKSFYAKWQKDEEIPPIIDPVPPIEEPDPPQNDPTYSDMQIVSLIINGVNSISIDWNESDYAKISMQASKMPKYATDFDIKTPENVRVLSITKRAKRSSTHPLTVMRATTMADPTSDIWDIMLQSTVNHDLVRAYMLEIVPVADEDQQPVPPFGGNNGGASGSSSSSSSSAGSSSNSGSSSSSSSSSSSNSHASSSSSSDAESSSSSGTYSNNDNSSAAVEENEGSDSSDDKTMLAATGDVSTTALSAIGVIVALAALLAFGAYRRRIRNN